MRWVTRSGLHVDRTACAWLITHYIDRDAEFVFVPASTEPGNTDGHTFDMRGAEFTHIEDKCTFEVLLERHSLTRDTALCAMGKIIRDADVPARGRRSSESAGLDAIMRGFQLGIRDDYEKLRLTAPVYDALYVYCMEKVSVKPHSQATPRPRLSYRRRFLDHVQEATNGEGDA